MLQIHPTTWPGRVCKSHLRSRWMVQIQPKFSTGNRQDLNYPPAAAGGIPQ